MVTSLLLGAALLLGQTDAPRARLLPPVGGNVVVEAPRAPVSGQPAVLQTPAAVTRTSLANPSGVMQSISGALGGAGLGNSRGHGHDNCNTDCNNRCDNRCNNRCDRDCDVECLRRWTCDDLKMKPVDHRHRCGCGLFGHMLWCPQEEEACHGHGNGNGNGNGNPKGESKEKTKADEKKSGVAREVPKDGNGEAAEEEAPELNPLMQVIECRFPALFDRLDCRGAKVYGWLQGGYTFNLDSPDDRLNYGTNFNNRSNDFLLNQAYIVLEKPLDLEKRQDDFHIGYRVDFLAGHDTPYFENVGLGLFDNFTGDSLEYSRLSEMGIGMPQFYVDIHAPILTERGVDFRLGRFFTHMTWELSPATSTYFYSHSYEYFYAMPFTHLAATATIHFGDTVDVMQGITRGWDVVFDDTNDTNSYIGSYIWNSCDKRQNVAIAWTYGAERVDNNHDDRAVLTAYYTRKFGSCNEWMWVGGGGIGWEQGATADPLSVPRTAEWYSTSTYLFYTVDPRLTLGMRAEWFRDDDGARTAFANSDNGGAAFNRPGYAGNFYDLTFGVTWKPFQNLRVRPELRFDWFRGEAIDGSASRPFNDQTDRFQTTVGVDVIYEF
jgi:hypothetical protein